MILKLIPGSTIIASPNGELRLYFDTEKFGIFIWLSADGELNAFQADHQSQYAMHFSRPKKLIFGGVNNDPISGGITGKISEHEIKILKDTISNFEFPELPELFKKIREIAQGNVITDFSLPLKEIHFLKKQRSHPFLRKFW